MAGFVSSFTGPEIDAALRKSLGNIYGDALKPGTRLIGEFIEDPIDLNELKTPGVFTAYFYLHGPKSLNDISGNTPISINVFKNTNPETTLNDGNDETSMSLWQTIVALSFATEDIPASGIRAGDVIVNFYYRDLNGDPTELISENSTAEGYGWQYSLMTSGTTTVINNLSSTSINAALSANMGRYLKKLIDEDDDGVTNLLPCSTPAITKYNSETFFRSNWKLPTTGVSFASSRDTYHKTGKFDPVSYYRSLLNDDYVQIASNSQTKSYVVELEPKNFVEIRPTDKAFTASVFVKVALTSSDLEPWVKIQLYTKNNGNTDSIIETSLIVENEYETENIEGEGDAMDTTAYLSTEYPSVVIGRITLPSAKDTSTNKYVWMKITATLEGVDLFYNHSATPARYVGMSFGFDAPGIAGSYSDTRINFAHAKLERGKIATDSSLTYAEMWNEFNNANYLNSIPISKDVATTSSGSLRDGQGIIYNGANGHWINRYITAGGGGGFVAQAYPPDMYLNDGVLTEYDAVNKADRQKLLWYVYGTGSVGKCDLTANGTKYECYEGSFYFFDGIRWSPCETNYIVSNTAPMNKQRLWLDTSSINTNYDVSYGPDEPADLKYYDANYNEWRTVGSEPKPGFVVQDTEPTGPDADLMWITTKGVASVPYWKDNGSGGKTKVWLPIQAIWGHNTTT